MIDWSVALEGPLLYDLASAVMDVGGLGRGDEKGLEDARRWLVQLDGVA